MLGRAWRNRIAGAGDAANHVRKHERSDSGVDRARELATGIEHWTESVVLAAAN